MLRTARWTDRTGGGETGKDRTEKKEEEEDGIDLKGEIGDGMEQTAGERDAQGEIQDTVGGKAGPEVPPSRDNK